MATVDEILNQLRKKQKDTNRKKEKETTVDDILIETTLDDTLAKAVWNTDVKATLEIRGSQIAMNLYMLGLLKMKAEQEKIKDARKRWLATSKEKINVTEQAYKLFTAGLLVAAGRLKLVEEIEFSLFEAVFWILVEIFKRQLEPIAKSIDMGGRPSERLHLRVFEESAVALLPKDLYPIAIREAISDGLSPLIQFLNEYCEQ